jgi:hypothetical protein
MVLTDYSFLVTTPANTCCNLVSNEGYFSIYGSMFKMYLSYVYVVGMSHKSAINKTYLNLLTTKLMYYVDTQKRSCMA